jgi:hypothetical protein
MCCEQLWAIGAHPPIQAARDRGGIERGSLALNGAGCKAALKGWEA